jgi:hypothetical protein
MSQYVRPGSNSTTYVNDVISITTPSGSVGFGTPGTVTEVVVPDLAYAHTQGTASATWTVNHNLDFYPNVTVVDSGGTIVEGEIAYTSRNQVVLTFTAAFSGKAYLS